MEAPGANQVVDNLFDANIMMHALQLKEGLNFALPSGPQSISLLCPQSSDQVLAQTNRWSKKKPQTYQTTTTAQSGENCKAQRTLEI